jgi:hypothetical protein
MATIVCPNCGYKQENGQRCRSCSTLFSYHEGTEDSPAPTREGEPAPGPTGWKMLGWAYRIFQWSSVAGLVIVILLILHQSPPPKVPSDPQAAARVETKLQESASAAQAGQPHELELDSTELNSLLGSSLDLKTTPADTPATTEAPGATPIPAQGAEPAPAVAPANVEPSIEEVQSSVKDVKVNMVGDQVQAYVVFDFHGKDMSLELDGHLRAEDGYLHFEPTSGKLGSLPLPQSTLEAAVRRLFESPINKEKMRLPPDVSDIQVRNGDVVVSYR